MTGEIKFERHPSLLDWPSLPAEQVLVVSEPLVWMSQTSDTVRKAGVLLPMVGERHIQDLFTRSVHFAVKYGNNLQLVSINAHNMTLAYRNGGSMNDRVEIIHALINQVHMLNQPD